MSCVENQFSFADIQNYEDKCIHQIDIDRVFRKMSTFLLSSRLNRILLDGHVITRSVGRCIDSCWIDESVIGWSVVGRSVAVGLNKTLQNE